MGQGIPGGLPKAAFLFAVVPRHNGRRTYFTIESHTDVDRNRTGRARVFWNIDNANKRAAELDAAKEPRHD